jgi:hypothetical protein
MDIVAILGTALKAIFGYAIMFGIITLLSLPFIYSFILYDRLKERSLITEPKLENPFRFLQDIHKRHQKDSIKKNLYVLRHEIQEQRMHIREQSQKFNELSKVNQQLMSIVIKMRQSLRD